jgi:CheY-like chemotaxis protein
MIALVVDDEDNVRRMIKAILQRRGLVVYDASNGEDALALYRQHPIDIVVTDVVMPGMDGIALAHTLAEINPGVAVLMISGYPGGIEPARLRIPRWASLAKPFTAGDLMKAISELAGTGSVPD